MPPAVDWTNVVLVGISALALVGGGTAWLMRLERRLANKLTREEHQRICDEHQKRISNQLTTMDAKLDERERYTDRHRYRLLGKLENLRIEVAVLQDRAGIRRTPRFEAEDVARD